MARLSRLFALLVAFLLMPGSAEAMENVVHIVSEGHTAHAFDDADHEPEGDEHGCTGTVHCCSCCGTVSFLVSTETVVVPPPVWAATAATTLDAGRPLVAHTLGVDRPPSA